MTPVRLLRRRLRLLTPLLPALLLLVSAGVLLVYMLGRENVAHRQHQAAHQALSQQRALESEAPALGLARDRLASIPGVGTDNATARLVWAQRLQQAARAQGLPEPVFTLHPASPLESAPELTGGGLQASRMHFLQPLTHERQLLELLDALDAAPGARQHPRGCRVARGRGEHPLEAECELDWLSQSAPAGARP
ncbi:MAG: hypothetical protein REI09_03830 [Candidatus Dactylopiibacterium sp.]|nr:hypothetical protein [Candidatus Dactylopiibacterium sp.]